MGIRFNKATKVFIIETENTSYQMMVAEYGYLEHLYYGRRIAGETAYLPLRLKRSFTCNPDEAGRERIFSTDCLMQEYPTFGVSDFRSCGLSIINHDGSDGVDLRYASHRIYTGKYDLPGLPHAHGDGFETLEITLADPYTQVKAVLLYSMDEKTDLITRAVKIINAGTAEIALNKVMSACLDFDNPDYELMSFYGQWTDERNVERTPLRHGKITIDSARGVSSHHQNPTAIILTPGTDERKGECYGLALVYSGNFSYTAEVDGTNQTRFVIGMNPDTFSWQLKPGESFNAPEVLMSFSAAGLSRLSANFHQIIGSHICRGKYKYARRPVLINNWEATKMSFTEEHLMKIAVQGKDLGIEMFVVDDGWFGKRDDDFSGLGDWYVNREKFPQGLAAFRERLKAVDMKFGIWVEPEMVNEDSDLYRQHPDWAYHIPGRKPARGRYQMVLDMGREDVREYLYQSLREILQHVDYVKWDMNRSITDVWTAKLPPKRQGEALHRYTLGVYDLLEKLTAEFPDVLFEGCCSGGGRFDAGMLYYTPQIWCSDNTDAVARIGIQYGTSFFYPASTIGAHVSECPNQQTGRTVSLDTRAAVAYYGTFGYEMDLNPLSAAEKEQVREHIAFFKEHYQTLVYGSYYRLTNVTENKQYSAWMSVAENKKEAVMTYVLHQGRSNPPIRRIRLQGLLPNAFYQINNQGQAVSGSALMYAGLTMPVIYGDNVSIVMTLKCVEE